MDFGHYAERAIELANADLDTFDGLRSHLAPWPRLRARVTAADLRPVRRLQASINAVIDASAAGKESSVVSQLNALLEQHPIRPRISGHDTEEWHLHVSDSTQSVANVLAAQTLFGMALVVTELGPDRFGRCAADDCSDAFLDSSANQCRRFCGSRCATRTNVAAFRRRQQPVA